MGTQPERRLKRRNGETRIRNLGQINNRDTKRLGRPMFLGMVM